MVTAEATQLRMTHAEYCAFEREAAIKNEYLAGEVFAMTGGTLEHSRLAAQIGHLLLSALAGGPCRVLSADAPRIARCSSCSCARAVTDG